MAKVVITFEDDPKGGFTSHFLFDNPENTSDIVNSETATAAEYIGLVMHDLFQKHMDGVEKRTAEKGKQNG